MGTNYYLQCNVCEHCNRSDEPLHIGKSSFGWCFSLRVYPDLEINDLPDWEKLWFVKGNRIVNEYGDTITPEEMHKTIAERKLNGEKDPYHSEGFLSANHAEPGPGGLLRHRRDGLYGARHGAGTWDLCDYEFS